MCKIRIQESDYVFSKDPYYTMAHLTINLIYYLDENLFTFTGFNLSCKPINCGELAKKLPKKRTKINLNLDMMLVGQ